jgi:hypothetical protein
MEPEGSIPNPQEVSTYSELKIRINSVETDEREGEREREREREKGARCLDCHREQ